MAGANIDRAKSKQIGDELASDMMTWFSADVAKETVNECLQFLQKLVQSLKNRNLDEVKSKDLAQMSAYIGKMLDQIARLTQFSQGQPDSRPAVTIDSLLPFLSENEFAIFTLALARWEKAQSMENQTPTQDIGDGIKSQLH